jgi:hypothetical protein
MAWSFVIFRLIWLANEALLTSHRKFRGTYTIKTQVDAPLLHDQPRSKYFRAFIDLVLGLLVAALCTKSNSRRGLFFFCAIQYICGGIMIKIDIEGERNSARGAESGHNSPACVFQILALRLENCYYSFHNQRFFFSAARITFCTHYNLCYFELHISLPILIQIT